MSDIEFDRILRLRDVVERTGLSKPTIYRWISEGSFPPPVRLGRRNSGWRAADIRAWISERAVVTVRTARDADPWVPSQRKLTASGGDK